jgi:hypothetical protein
MCQLVDMAHQLRVQQMLRPARREAGPTLQIHEARHVGIPTLARRHNLTHEDFQAAKPAVGPCAMIHRDTYDVFLDEQVARQQRVARERAERERERERLQSKDRQDSATQQAEERDDVQTTICRIRDGERDANKFILWPTHSRIWNARPSSSHVPAVRRTSRRPHGDSDRRCLNRARAQSPS